MYMSNKSLLRETVKVTSVTIFCCCCCLERSLRFILYFFSSLAHYLILVHAFKYHVMIL